MRIFLFVEYYSHYLNDFYKKKSFADLPYDQHLSYLIDDYFGSFGSYLKYFRGLGHEVELVIGNDFLLQNKWLKERGIKKGAGPANKKETVLLQVREFKPHVFFMSSMYEYYGTFLKEVAETTPNIFTWIAASYPKNLDFSHVRCVISSVEDFVARFRNLKVNSEVLKAAFDADIAARLDNKRTMDVSFVGGLSRRTHARRMDGLEYVLKSGIDLKTYGYGLKRQLIPFRPDPIHRSYGGALWGMEMYRALNHSRISLNFHIDFVKNWAGNMRLYEGTGCGTVLLTESAEGLDEMFDVGKEIVVYDSLNDLVEKITYYLAHEAEREAIAAAGQRACIERHGYDRRIVEFDAILKKYST
ncbi:MAG TPA: glycosyltransferase [Syntrophorhabdaceae bacterium]|jgi:hypothetical protein